MGIITLDRKKIFNILLCLAFFGSLSSLKAQCPTVSNLTQTFCDIESPTVANLAATANGNGVAWFATAASTTALSPTLGLADGEDYFADDISGSCGARVRVVVTVYGKPFAQSFQGPCVDNASDATIADLTATGNNVQWYLSPSGGSPLPSTTVLSDNTFYYASQTNPNTGCETSRRSVLVSVGVVPVPTGDPVQSFCNLPGTPPTLNDFVVSGDNNWYSTPSSAVQLPLSTPLVNGQSYYATTVDPPCESSTRFEVQAILVAPNNAGTNGAISICVNNLSTTPSFNLFPLLGGTPNNTGTWTGPLPTSNGSQGTVNVSTLTLAGSPYTFTYTVSSSLCPTATSTVTITILPVPVVSIAAATTTICSGSSATVTFTGTPNATVTYNIDGGAGQTIVLNAGGTAVVTNTYTTTTVFNLISVASATAPSCSQSQTGTVTINVLPLPTATVASDTTVCPNGSATVTFTGTPNATVTYTVNGGANQTIVLNGGGTATITTTFAASTVYALVSIASSGTPVCTRALTGSVTVTVRPLPTVTISGTASVCPNGSATITFTGTPNAIVTYTVNSGPNQTITLSAAGTAAITNTFNVNTIYALVSAVTGGTPACSQPQSGSVTITVLALPTATIGASSTICSGSSATVTFTGTPNATVTYTINGGANQTIVLNASGTATLTNTYTATSVFNLVSASSASTPSCSQPLTGTITTTVRPLPTVAISGNVTICPNSSATVTFTGTPNATVTYTVNGGPNQTVVLSAAGTATITNTYTVTTIYNVVSAATGGTPNCTQPQTGTVTVTVTPLPTVTISGTSSVCPNGTATITFTGTPNATVTYTINGGANQTITLNAGGTASIVGPYTATTIFALVSVATAGTPSCSQPQTGSATITVIPLPTVTIASSATICIGASATVTFTGTPNAIATYTINGGANQTIPLNAAGTATITNTYSATAIFNLVSAATSGTPSCSQPQTGTVTITVVPPPTVAISANATICSGDSATVTFTGTPNATVTYNINGSASQTILLSAAGTATVTNTYTATTVFNLVSILSSGTPGCSQPQTGSVTITVVPPPTGAIGSNATICSGQSATVTFTGTSNATVTYNVNGGASQTIVLSTSGTATITNTYTATTVFNLVSIATSGTPVCTRPVTGTITITVLPLPVVTIASSTSTICSGATGTVTFTGTPNAIVTYTINGGSNQTITLNPSGTATLTNTYTATSVFTLVSIATSGTPSCSQPQTGTVTITVIPPPTVTITSSAATICSGGSATVTFTGTPNAVVIYTVNGGPNQTITLNASGTATVTNAYTANTVFALVSISTSGTPVCTLPLNATITINVIPLPTVTIASNVTICSGQTATVTFTGTPNATVTYTLNGGANQTIVLNAAGTATVANTYTANAVFALVSVATSGTPSCSQPQSGTVTITVTPLPTVTISGSATICSGDTAIVTFTGTPNATVTYNINSGTNQTIVLSAAGAATISNTYTTTTTFNLVSVVSQGTPGCVQPVAGTITITVIPPPTVTIASNMTICAGQSATVTFTGTANATVTYNIDGGADQTIVLSASGTATITLSPTATSVINLVSIVTSGSPICTRPVTGTVTISVLPLPVATIGSTTSTICSGSIGTVTFTGTPNATVTYTINGGSNQTITLDATGTATLSNTYTATSVFNLVSVATTGTPACSQPQTGTVTITVIPPPTVAITASAATICSGDSAIVTFTGTPDATVVYTINGGLNQTITLDALGTATLTNTYNANAVFTLVSISTSGTPVCTVPLTATITITVVPPPTATIASDVTICTGQSATVTFTGTPNATVTYTIDGGSNQTIVLNATGTAAVVNTYTANTVFALVSVATSGTPSCSQPQTGTVTITVLPLPIAAISANATICAGSSATITFTGTPNATITYTINGGSDQTIVLDASGNAVLTNTYAATAVFDLVSVTSPGTPACVQPVTGTVTITVIPLPTVAIASNVTICSGASATVTFTGTPNAVVTYTVDGGSNQTVTLDATGTAPVTNTYTTTTVFALVDITLPGAPSCGQPQTGTVTITVEPVPFVTISGDATICAGDNVTISFTGTPNATVTYNDGTSDQNIILDATGSATISTGFSTTTTFTLVSVTSAGTPGCTQPQTGAVTITVIPLPTVSVVVNTNVCLGQASNIIFNGTPNAVVTYNIEGGTDQQVTLDASGTAAVSITFAANAVINLVSIQTMGTPICVRPLTDAIAITVNPLPTVVISGGATICAGSITPIQFTGTPNTIVTYTINNGSNLLVNIGASGTTILNNPYTVTSVFDLVSVASANPPNCSQPQTGTVTVTVTQPPNAGSNAVLPLCGNSAPQDLFLLLGSTAQTGGTWSPSLASGTGVFDPAVDNSGTFTYTVAGTPPCVNDTASATVTVTPQTDAGIDGTASLCSNADPIDLFTFLGGTPQTGGTWSPALPSGTGVFNPNSDPAGVYTYTITGIAPCVDDSSTVTVSVTPGPDAGLSGSATFCADSAPQDLFLSLGGTPQVGGIWSPALASGSGIFDPAVDIAGVYTYTFSGTLPCEDDTATVTVTVTPIPDAGQDGTASFCSNGAPSDLFASLGGSPQTGGTWSPALASGTGIFNPLVDAPGTYTYTVGGAPCPTDTAEVVVTVFQAPNAGGLGATLLINTCQIFNAIDLTTGLNGTQDSGTWNDDDATAALTGNIFNPSIVGPGTYHFTYTVTGGVSPCPTDSATVTVVVEPGPDAGTFTAGQGICASVGTFDLLTLLTGNLPGGVFTDGNNIVVTNPIDVSALAGGTYSYLYTVTNACGSDSEFLQLTILENPVLTLSDIQVTNPLCIGQSATVSISNLADGDYTLVYDLSGSNVLAGQTVTVTITGGAGSFDIDSTNIPNAGITTITFLNITSTASNCSAAITDVATNFEIIPNSDLTDADISVTNVCAGSDISVIIANAAGLPDGDYMFDFSIPTGTPTTGTSTKVSIENGGGQFIIPASYVASAGNYTLTITSIIGLNGACGNPNENATVNFEVQAAPVLNLADVVVSSPLCVGQSALVSLSNLADGTYTLNYDLSNANVLTNQTVTVTISGGVGSFSINATAIPNTGTTTITFLNIANASNSCSSVIANVSVDFIINTGSDLTDADLSIANVCAGSDATIAISNAVGLPDGDYQFDFSIPTGTPAAGTTAAVTITSGNGSFVIPASYIASPGNYAVTITAISSLTSGCNNLNENATANFNVQAAPSLTQADVLVSSPLCVGQNAVVSLSNLADGTYTINYDLSNANVLANQTATVTITGGVGSFTISATDIPNTGTTTVTFLNITDDTTSCSGVIANVNLDFMINTGSDLTDADLSIANVCAGSDATVTITNAVGLPDGDYQFDFSLPSGTPATGTTATVTIAGGNGQFIIPASYVATAGNYALTITAITSVTSGCNNLNENATANFQVLAAPVLNLADVLVASPLCLGQNAVVSFSNLADGTYTLNYDLSNANVLANQNVTVTITAGIGSFEINATDIPNTGTTTITFLNITDDTSSCASVIANVNVDFTINTSADLTDGDLSISDICAGSDATVTISNAVGLPDGDYQFDFSIPTGTPTTGTTATVTVTSGNGQFIIPASFIAAAGNYAVTITTITSLTSGCNNLNENATANFQVLAIPNVTGASLQATASCPNFGNQVSISGATNLPDGDYTIDYQLSGANTATETATVTFTGGNGFFTIPANDLVNPGTVTVNVSQIAGVASQCGLTGNIFTAINFEISQPAEPQLEPKGNEFCGTDNPKPSIASLSANILGGDELIWYDAALGGTAYADTDLLTDGTTYYGATVVSGCESATRLAVTVDLTKCDEVIIPDGFSPNGDGINDTFTIKNLRETYPNFRLEIYNRYGNILYKGNISSADWDGTNHEAGLKLGDSLLPVGVYFYIVEFNNGIREPKQGRVYLNR